MKYLIAVCCFLICSSFISFRFVERGRDRWELYIYPIEGDTATYIVEKFFHSGGNYEKKPRGAWRWKDGGYYIHEYYYLKNVLERDTYCSFSTDDTFCSENYYRMGKVKEERSGKELPTSRLMYFNESTELATGYYKNGLLHNCTVTSYFGETEGMEWDIHNQTCWAGKYEIAGSYSDTTIVNNWDTLDENTHRIATKDITAKQGLWKKYNRAGKVIDSMFYK